VTTTYQRRAEAAVKAPAENADFLMGLVLVWGSCSTGISVLVFGDSHPRAMKGSNVNNFEFSNHWN